jgi:plastocyanin
MLVTRLVIAGIAGYLLTAAPSGPAARVHEIQMGSRSGTRFEPATTAAHPGDTLRFLNGNGGPHNVQFFGDSIPDSMSALLDKAMPGEKIGWLSSQLFLDRGEVYEIILPALSPGRYAFVCLPHYSANMSGAIVVSP